MELQEEEETAELSFSSCRHIEERPCEDIVRSWPFAPKKRTLTRHHLSWHFAGTLILDIQTPELWENKLKFLLFKPPSLQYFMAAWVDWNISSLTVLFLGVIFLMPYVFGVHWASKTCMFTLNVKHFQLSSLQICFLPLLAIIFENSNCRYIGLHEFVPQLTDDL